MSLKNEDEASGGVPWHVLDATKSIEELHSQIDTIVNETVQRVENKPILTLWDKK